MNPKLPMPIKATPFQHQRDAFDFACRIFRLTKKPRSRDFVLRGGGVRPMFVRSLGCAYLMDMG